MKKHVHFHPVSIVYQNLNFYTMVPEKKIVTVGSAILNMFRCGSGPKHRVDILKNISGRIQKAKLTLVMGPPGEFKAMHDSCSIWDNDIVACV